MRSSLNAEMARCGIKTKDIAELLEITDKTARAKITGNSFFSDKEMKKIRDKFFPRLSIDYLFIEDLGKVTA